jgi:hypothetical protein
VNATYFRGLISDFYPEDAALELRVDGQLAFYYGTGSAVDAQLPSDLTLQNRAATCANSSECGEWSAFDLEMRVGDGDPVVVGSGATTSDLSYEYRNIFNVRVTRTLEFCSDWSVGGTTVAVASRTPRFMAP